ncbi:MAG TPA: cupin domain-containing protein [Pirellulaceae bacterium]|nr:cupin domain-containing protein [Pirellulaceae bacterium]
MILHQLLGTVPLQLFMEEYFLKLPFSLAGGCAHLMPLGNWDVIGRLLTAPDVDVVVGSGGERYGGQSPRAADEARHVLAAGYTIGIRHAQRHDPSLATLAGGFFEAFAAPIDIHLYCTPANHRGFGWHYDAEEVFILQLRGSKEWSLRKNTVNPWPLVETLPKDMRYEREIMPLTRCKLEAGDWLYIPGGYWHMTQAGADESVSLSVGVLFPAAIDVYDFVRQRLLSSLRWRQRLGCFGSAAVCTPAKMEDDLRALFRDLADDVARMMRDDGLVRDFIDAMRSKPNTE